MTGRSLLVAGLAAGCSDDDGEAPPPVAPVILSAESALDMAYGWARFGAALAFTADGRLAVGQPAWPLMNDADNVIDDRVWLFDSPSFVLRMDGGLDDTWDEGEPYLGIDENGFGSGLVAAGDLTGDGVDDLAVAESAHPERGDGEWAVFAGPDLTSAVFVDGWATAATGASCGDLNGDGIAELCTTDGVLLGPITATSTPALTWTDDVVVIGSRSPSELLLGSPDALYEVAAWTGIDPVDLSTVANHTWAASSGHAVAQEVGDLDADGTPDLVAAWTSPDVIYVGLPSDGGDAAQATTIIEWAATTLAVADFDGDCVDDLAAGGGGEVAVWRGPLPVGSVTVEVAAAWYRGLQYPNDGFGTSLVATSSDDCEPDDLAIGAPLEEDFSPERYESGRAWWLAGAGL